jgi:hypothetical protein
LCKVTLEEWLHEVAVVILVVIAISVAQNQMMTMARQSDSFIDSPQRRRVDNECCSGEKGNHDSLDLEKHSKLRLFVAGRRE